MLSVIGTAAVRALSERVGQALDIRRFRQNVVLEPVDGTPYMEEESARRQLVFGADTDSAGRGPRSPVRRDHRCMR